MISFNLAIGVTYTSLSFKPGTVQNLDFTDTGLVPYSGLTNTCTGAVISIQNIETSEYIWYKSFSGLSIP